jgi:hypothetical protein
VPERSSAHQGDAATAALRAAVIVAFALVPLLAAGCGDEAGEDAGSRTATVAATTGETATETVPEETTETAPTTPTAPAGPVVRFSGNGDRTLAPIRVGRGGATLIWENDDAVFSVFSDVGLVVDSVEPRGEAFVPAGRRLLDVVASGAWRIEIRNARRAP